MLICGTHHTGLEGRKKKPTLILLTINSRKLLWPTVPIRKTPTVPIRKTSAVPIRKTSSHLQKLPRKCWTWLESLFNKKTRWYGDTVMFHGEYKTKLDVAGSSSFHLLPYQNSNVLILPIPLPVQLQNRYHIFIYTAYELQLMCMKVKHGDGYSLENIKCFIQHGRCYLNLWVRRRPFSMRLRNGGADLGWYSKVEMWTCRMSQNIGPSNPSTCEFIESIGIYWLYQFGRFFEVKVLLSRQQSLWLWWVGSLDPRINRESLVILLYLDVRWVESCILKIEVHEDPRLHGGQGESLKKNSCLAMEMWMSWKITKALWLHFDSSQFFELTKDWCSFKMF